MKHNLFTFKNNRILCWRLGPINSQKQTHFHKDTETPAGKGQNKPPTSRGIWAFPYPHYDYFFCFHQWTKHLPKKFLYHEGEWTEEESEEYEKTLRRIQRTHRPSTFFVNEFYSHIFPDDSIRLGDWYYYDNARQWAKLAQKTFLKYERWGGRLYKIHYSKDHLELFIPNY